MSNLKQLQDRKFVLKKLAEAASNAVKSPDSVYTDQNCITIPEDMRHIYINAMTELMRVSLENLEVCEKKLDAIEELLKNE